MWEKAQALPRYDAVFEKSPLDEALLNRLDRAKPHPHLLVARALVAWPRCLHGERKPRWVGDPPANVPDQEALARATLAAFPGR